MFGKVTVLVGFHVCGLGPSHLGWAGALLRAEAPRLYRLYIVCRQVLKAPLFLHLEPSLDALSLRSDVISSIKIFSLAGAANAALEVAQKHVDSGDVTRGVSAYRRIISRLAHAQTDATLGAYLGLAAALLGRAPPPPVKVLFHLIECIC